MSGGESALAGRLSVLLQWRLVVFVLIRIELAKYSVSFLVIFFSLSLA
jgi:hypothetical protein